MLINTILLFTKARVCSASRPSTPTSQRSTGILPEMEGKANQLQAFTPDAKKVATRAKIYFNLYLTSRNAFPSPVELKQFQNSAVDNANRDLNDTLHLHPGFANLVCDGCPYPADHSTPPFAASLPNASLTTAADGKVLQPLISHNGTNSQAAYQRSENV
jgi:hypothetical protein